MAMVTIAAMATSTMAMEAIATMPTAIITMADDCGNGNSDGHDGHGDDCGNGDGHGDGGDDCANGGSHGGGGDDCGNGDGYHSLLFGVSRWSHFLLVGQGLRPQAAYTRRVVGAMLWKTWRMPRGNHGQPSKNLRIT